jgi:hypothetical protein
LRTTVRPRRPRTVVLAAAALMLATTPAAFAQEGEDPAEEEVEEEIVEGSVTCDAELLDDEDGFPFYFTEPGEVVTCTAEGLDPEVDAEWAVDVYAYDLFDEEAEDPEEPTETIASDGNDEVAEDGTLTFAFTIPEDITFGFFDGTVTQTVDEELTYEAFFGGVIFGLLEGDMECDPDPAPRGSDVECTTELGPGAFDWEVYELSVDELLDVFFGEGEIEPSDDGTAEADEDGIGTYGFTLASTGDADLYLTIAYQDDAAAIYAGEIVDADDRTGGPGGGAPETEDDPVVTVQRPNRVDAGAGGTAPAGSAPALALGLALALAAAASAGAVATRKR